MIAKAFRSRSMPGRAAAHDCRQGRNGHISRRDCRTFRAVGTDVNGTVVQEPGVKQLKSQVDARWDRITAKLVDYSAIAFVLLLLPQIIKNAVALRAGSGDSLAGLAWVGFLTALMGNTQLLGYFLDKGERSAAAIQAIGVLSNYGILLQVAVAGHLPAALPPALVIAFCVSGLVFSARLSGRLSSTAQLWRVWQAAMAVLGIISVPQVLWGTFTASHSLLPAAIAAVPAFTLVVTDAAGGLSGRLAQLWGVLSAWTATLLFCCQPIAQLATNFTRPDGVASLSLGTLLLAMVGNAMMWPRAVYIKDVVWMTGSLWGSVAMGLGNLLSLAVANARFGIGSFTPGYFALASLVMIAYVSYVLWMTAQARAAEAKLPQNGQLHATPHADPPAAEGHVKLA